MPQVYDDHGFRIRYPDNWELTEQPEDGRFSLTVSSPETSFWSIMLLEDGPSAEDVLASAVETFRDEYDEVDTYTDEAAGEIAVIGGLPAMSQDVEFVCLELINSAFLRAIELGHTTALVMYQGTDHELEETRPVLEAITASLEWQPPSF